MKIKIKNRFTSSFIFETDAETIGQAVVAAITAKVNLRDAYLRGADLRGADLRGANLCDADLRDADLCDAYLRGADLRGADLRGANLRGADLRGANLCDADLRDADLRGADLRGADLRGANLRGAELRKLISMRTILPDGDFIGWKKLLGKTICKLKIPADAKRVGGLIGRKCRAEYAVVMDGEGESQYDSTKYKIGETVIPDSYDPNPLVECSHGIHFFITKKEAEDY